MKKAIKTLKTFMFLLLVAAGCSDESTTNAADELPDASSDDTSSNNTPSNNTPSNNATDAASMDTDPASPADVIGSDDDPCFVDGDDLTTLVFINNCLEPLNVRGSDIEDALIDADARTCRHIGTANETLSAKRYWGFIGEDPGGGRHTLAEFTFNTDFQDFDWYNISHVDAHNLTMQIVPLERDDCATLTCDDEALLTTCPEAGRYTDGAGELSSCVSPDRDDPQSVVARHFEACDDGYAWSGDDQHGDDPSPVRACAGEDWAIVFCP